MTPKELTKIEPKRVLPVKVVVSRLENLRAEWETATEGKSLLETKAVVALLLLDFCRVLELTPTETEGVVGEGIQEAIQ
jgi:hypothetical protein